MTDAERIALGLTKKLTYRYTFASGDFNFLEKHKNTNYLRALAHLGIYNNSGESFNEKYFTPDSIGQLKQKKDGDDTIKLEKPLYISDFVAPLEQIKRTIIPGGQLFDKDGNKLDPPLDLIKDEVMREAETKLTPPGVQLGLEGANQQQGGAGGTTGGAGGTTGGTGETTTGQPQGVIVNADPADEEAATNNDASSGGGAMSGGAASSGGTAVSDSTSIREKLNRLLGYKIENGSVVVDKKGKKVMALDKPPLSISAGVEPKIEDDGSISVDGDVTINVDIKGNKGINIIENGKLAIKFSNVKGSFICRNRKLTSLEGCPKTVGKTFDCGENLLTSLAGAPQEVGIFIADKNKSLTSLAGGPKIINGITDTAKSQNTVIYDVSNCGLTTLDNNGITKFGPGGFNCALNKLTNLNGLGIVASTGVVSFDCSKNELTSLNGIPRPIKDAKSGKPGSYWIRDNAGITLFPVTMADFEIDNFEAGGLSLTSLSFAPKKVYGSFNCVGNKGTKKLTNQSIGKDRFKVGGGFEEDAGARIVAIDGEFVTSEGSWNNKTYGIDTVFKKPEFASADTGFETTTSGNLITSGGATWSEIPDPSTIKVLYKIAGEYQKPGGGIQFEFEVFRPIGMAGPDTYNRSWNASYAKGRTNPFQRVLPDGTKGFRSWEMEFPNIKNYINWSMFEGGAAGWGWAQPTGAFIVNGVNYGGKTVEAARKYAAMFWIDASGPHLGRGNDIYNDGGDYTKDAVKSINNSKAIRYSAPGSALVIEEGRVRSYTPEELTKLGLDSGTSFIGHLKNGKWFAGTTGVPDPGKVAASIQSYYKGNVQNLGVSDGSASRQCFINGKKLSAPGRPVSVALAW